MTIVLVFNDGNSHGIVTGSSIPNILFERFPLFFILINYFKGS